MSIIELREKIAEQQFRLEKAKSTGMMVPQETERLRNILINNLEDIVAALDVAVDAEKKIELLTVEIESADAELQEKDDEIKELKAELEKPNSKKVAGKRAEIPAVDESSVE